MKVGSTFSGIGGMDIGLERAGMKVIWQVEIDPFRRRILGRHWPDVERFEDVRIISGDTKQLWEDKSNTENKIRKGLEQRNQPIGATCLEPVDLLCGGFPCQDLSIAGRRGGIHAERSGLFFEFARLAGELRPDWLLIENVPGLLSSNKGEDFETVLQTLSELGYVVAWRILDSRYFGVPQRRRRVYIVGHIRADCAAAVLFEPAGGSGDTEKGGEKGEGVAYALTGSPRGTGDGHENVWNTTYVPEVSHALTRRDYKSARPEAGGAELVCTPADPDGVREATGVPRRLDPQPLTGDVAYALAARNRRGISMRESENTLVASTIVNPGKQWNSQQSEPNLITGAAESIQRPPRASKPCCPDGPRYAALGDAVTTNVVEWIGRRMILVEELISGERK